MPTSTVRPTALARSDAILRILDIVTSDSDPAKRLLLEGIAYVAQQPPYSESECRVLRAFDSEEWLLDFHESLAYLQQMGRVARIKGRYVLTQPGRERLQTLEDPAEASSEDEIHQIQQIAQKVQVGFGL